MLSVPVQMNSSMAISLLNFATWSLVTTTGKTCTKFGKLCTRLIITAEHHTCAIMCTYTPLIQPRYPRQCNGQEDYLPTRMRKSILSKSCNLQNLQTEEEEKCKKIFLNLVILRLKYYLPFSTENIFNSFKPLMTLLIYSGIAVFDNSSKLVLKWCIKRYWVNYIV